MESTSMKETERNCVLCCQELDIFALGKCEHPVCYRCSTKMRILCDQKYCAVCREELDKVIFVKDLQPFSTLPFQQLQCEKKHDIYFSDGKIYAQFRRLLLPECPHCPEPKVFSKFEELEQHMRKQHELFCCKLCTKHLKIFSHERKWYNRKDLARHRTQGDPDDTSHRGHPLCKFCDDRYLDNDELLKHLRRDHYFCHFCDADGAQEYYSDYQYLSEHFRESHYLCEEGRCSTEQFTHAFRTEIDYKAHKASAHSKNRAEARQNRHIDLQFTYAPRQQRRNEGMVSAEDYEEMRQARAGRGRTQGHQQNTRGSWRYNREEEDREVAAAMRASMAVRRQEERGAAQERSAPKHRKEERMERMERMETEETRHRAGPIKPPSEPPVRTMKSSSPLDGDDFPALGTMAPAPIPSLKQPAPAAAPPPAALKEDDFPSLSAAKVSSPMTPAYTAQPRKHSSFHDEDFPALVSKIRPPKQSGGANSAWAHGGSKPASQPSLPKAPPPADPPLPRPAGLQPLSRPAGPQPLPRPAGPQPLPRSAGPQPLTRPAGPQPLHSSSSSSSSRKKKKAGADGENARPEPPSEDDGTMTRQEFRAVPTMLDISSLLTVKGPAPSPSASNPSPPTPHPNPSPAPKAAKKKKQQQATPAPPPPSSASPAPADTVPRVAAVTQKENAPKTDGHAPKSPNAGKTNGLAKGCTEKPEKPLLAAATVFKPRTTVTPQPSPAPTPEEEEVEKEEEEEFPALTSKKPPPGFKSSFPLKSSAPQTALPPPPPPPGLASVPSKPPPGFTGIPLNSNVAEPPAPARPPQLPGTYLVPENFQQRNMELIQSIKNFLHNDESQFNQFKNYSGQFRQGLMSAAQYHYSCKDLLGENFGRIFNELLVLLPDTGKQQELLVAHGDSKALEKQGGAGGGKARKNKKSAWQTPSNAANANANAAELDCQICPTCRQVLAPKDFNSHKTLHMGENEEFPSLQAISRIIS